MAGHVPALKPIPWIEAAARVQGLDHPLLFPPKPSDKRTLFSRLQMAAKMMEREEENNKRTLGLKGRRIK